MISVGRTDFILQQLLSSLCLRLTQVMLQAVPHGWRPAGLSSSTVSNNEPWLESFSPAVGPVRRWAGRECGVFLPKQNSDCGENLEAVSAVLYHLRVGGRAGFLFYKSVFSFFPKQTFPPCWQPNLCFFFSMFDFLFCAFMHLCITMTKVVFNI